MLTLKLVGRIPDIGHSRYQMVVGVDESREYLPKETYHIHRR